MGERRLERDLPGLALLAEPVRRELYEYVAGSGRAVGRDEAAREVGVSRSLAAFHLDRLAEAGLLETGQARLSGRTGPGAGRPSKLYRRAAREFRVSIPLRDYEMPARLLADVMTGPDPSPERAKERARIAGLDLGAMVRRQERSRSRKRLLTGLRTVLSESGFDPRPEGRHELRLGNCPFHSLAQEFTGLMCDMNHAMLDGVVEGLGVPGVEASLDRQPGSCCVRFRW
jgi:predicted ArsR family transcriptional regulator